jgi:hypothetical protein
MITVPDIEALIGGTRARRRIRRDFCFHTIAIPTNRPRFAHLWRKPVPWPETNEVPANSTLRLAMRSADRAQGSAARDWGIDSPVIVALLTRAPKRQRFLNA